MSPRCLAGSPPRRHRRCSSCAQAAARARCRQQSEARPAAAAAATDRAGCCTCHLLALSGCCVPAAESSPRAVVAVGGLQIRHVISSLRTAAQRARQASGWHWALHWAEYGPAAGLPCGSKASDCLRSARSRQAPGRRCRVLRHASLAATFSSCYAQQWIKASGVGRAVPSEGCSLSLSLLPLPCALHLLLQQPTQHWNTASEDAQPLPAVQQQAPALPGSSSRHRNRRRRAPSQPSSPPEWMSGWWRRPRPS